MSKWDDKGVSSDTLKEKDSKKGEYYRAPGDRIQYIQKGLMKMYVPKDGKNKIRIIQPIEVSSIKFYGLEMHFHRGVGDEGSDLFGDYLCNQRMKGILQNVYPDLRIEHKCFRCEQQTPDLWDSNPDLAKSFYPERRMWFLVNDLLSDDAEEVLLWSCPWSVQEEIVSRSTNAETFEYIDVSHPKRGVPISFDKAGKGKLTKYTNVQLFKTPHPLTDVVADQRVEFKDLIVFPPYDMIKAAHLNVRVEDLEGLSKESSENKVSHQHTAVEQEAQAGEAAPPECFKKEYDKWQDCTSCAFAAECNAPDKEPEKPTRPTRQARPAKQDVGASKDESGDDKKEAIREKIRQAQARTPR